MGAHHVLESLAGDVRAFHLADQRRVGERVEIREGFDVDAVGLAVKEQRVRLDRVDHRRCGALGDVHVDGAQVLREDRAGRAVVGAHVLEHRGVSRLLRMVVDHQIDAVDLAAEVVRLHVHHADPVVCADALGRHVLDVNVEQVHHPQVLGPCHALHRADDGGGLGAAQHVAQRQPAGHRVGVRIVVQHDQHAVGVAEIALVLLHAGSGERAAHLGDERVAEQFGHRQIGDVGELGVELLGALRRGGGADAEQVDERAAGIARRLEDLARAAAAVVFDDDAGAGAEVGFEKGIRAARVSNDDGDASIV